MKGIRQDLTLQNVKDEFAAKCYEAHARLALQVPRLYYSTFSRTVWRLYGGTKGLLMMY
jgi:hypothetical protein